MNGKRAFDAVMSAVVLLTLWPVLAAIAVWIKLDSPGPVLYRQERAGLHGRTFRIRKFRTMQVGPQAGGELQLTVGRDPRITRAGRFLRRLKLDELPQMIDVLLGHMSIVGPRPEVPRYMDLYPEEIRAKVLSVRPGITDWASLNFRSEAELLADVDDPERAYVEDVLPVKQAYYVRYVDERTFLGDLRIIFCTVASIFRALDDKGESSNVRRETGSE